MELPQAINVAIRSLRAELARQGPLSESSQDLHEAIQALRRQLGDLGALYAEAVTRPRNLTTEDEKIIRELLQRASGSIQPVGGFRNE